MTREEYSAMVARANELSEAYYNGDEIASDAEFDGILEQIKEYEKSHKPSPDSPTQKVGEDNAKGFAKVLHDKPMLSLNKVLNLDELRAWCADTEKKVGAVTYTLEYKMDGCGLALVYEKGKLVQAVTRGNGIRGDDVTENSLQVDGVLKSLDYEYDIEVRGEVIFPKSEFAKAVAAGEQLKNCRNTASGALKLRDPQAVAKRKLRFYGYTLFGREHSEQVDDIKFLKQRGFTTVDVLRDVSAEKLVDFCNSMASRRDELDFDIDGMVIKVNSKSKQNELGASATNPKFAVAYKFPNVVVYPRIKDVMFQVGKTGMITPVALYEPMLLCGTTVQRASLHNRSIVEEMGIAIGDVVSVVKKGEIIPQVSGLHEKGSDRRPIVFPSECPCCGSRTEYVGERLYCTNRSCRDRVVALLAGWASKKCLDIDGLAEKTIVSLHVAGLVSKVTDLYRLTKEQLLGVEGFKEKSATSLIKAIEKSKSAGLSRVIAGLGIQGIGSTLAEELAGTFKDIDSLMRASRDEICAIEAVGEVKGDSVYTFLHENEELVAELKAIPDMVLGEIKLEAASDVLAGKSICITGTLSMSRDAMQAFIKSHGGNPANSVSGKTDYLVAGVGGGSKLAKAEKLGVKVITEAELYALVGSRP